MRDTWRVIQPSYWVLDGTSVVKAEYLQARTL